MLRHYPARSKSFGATLRHLTGEGDLPGSLREPYFEVVDASSPAVASGAEAHHSRPHAVEEVCCEKPPCRTPSTCSLVSVEMDSLERFLSEETDLPAAEQVQGRLWAAGHSIAKRGGENQDSFFVDVDALGVADGVASTEDFADQGMDSAAYAEEIMELTRRALQPGGGAADAASALQAAEDQATSFGATTAVATQLVGSSINIANLGDSGFMLLRRHEEDFEVVARSKEQQHEWNFPYQLMRLPPALAAQLPPGSSVDSAADCVRYDVPVCHGDLLLLFTDGLTDNLYEREITRLVEESTEEESLADPGRIAETLSEAAQTRTMFRTGRTPFADECAQHGKVWKGGKQDDITVVAAWVMLDESCRKAADSWDALRVD